MVEHVAVLMGGWSAEREVSLATGRECAAGLRSAGYRVDEVDVDRDVATRLLSLKPDVCLHLPPWRPGEDGKVQGLRNTLGPPYTHSGVTASALAMNKPQAKTIFEAYGLVCPEGMVVDSDTAPGDLPFPPPFVVKPVDEGSSVGVTIVRTGDNREKVAGDIWPHGHHVLVERFIPGRELTVAVFDGRAHCVTEITSDRGFYDYDAKYVPGGSRHILPADLPAAITRRALNWAETAYRVLGCRGVARCDFRFDDTADAADPEGDLYLLEINTQPGMTPTSLVPEQAQFIGVKFPQLVARMVEEARCDS